MLAEYAKPVGANEFFPRWRIIAEWRRRHGVGRPRKFWCTKKSPGRNWTDIVCSIIYGFMRSWCNCATYYNYSYLPHPLQVAVLWDANGVVDQTRAEQSRHHQHACVILHRCAHRVDALRVYEEERELVAVQDGSPDPDAERLGVHRVPELERICRTEHARKYVRLARPAQSTDGYHGHWALDALQQSQRLRNDLETRAPLTWDGPQLVGGHIVLAVVGND